MEIKGEKGSRQASEVNTEDRRCAGAIIEVE